MYRFDLVQLDATRQRELLRRIGYEGSLRTDLTSLRRLQSAFLTSIPFENLDIHLGNRIRMEFAPIWRKIVQQGRGGWCFEINELMLLLLHSVGFDVRRCAARVLMSGLGDPMDHQVTLLELDGATWLVDVGFGEFSLAPLAVPTRGAGDYSVEPVDGAWRVSRRRQEQWLQLYEFREQHRQRRDFAERCQWLQTSPESSFTRKRLCSLQTPEGRLTLSGNHLLLNGEVVQQVTEEEYADVLRARFGVDLGTPRWIRPLGNG